MIDIARHHAPGIRFTHASGNALATAAAALHVRLQSCVNEGGRLRALTIDDVYALLEAGAQEISCDAAVCVGGGGRIAMPVGEREAQSTATGSDADAAADADDAAKQRPRTIHDICSDCSIPPSLA